LSYSSAKLLRSMGMKVGILCRQSYATQFFVMRNRPDVVGALQQMKLERGRSLEASFYAAIHDRFSTRQVVPMLEREPVEPRHRYWCDSLRLYCQHWPAAGTAGDPRSPSDPLYVPPNAPGKRESLLQYSSKWQGEHVNQLLHAQSTDYYNGDAKRY